MYASREGRGRTGMARGFAISYSFPTLFVCMYASVCIRGCIQKKPGKRPENPYI
ncbi:hypothetical protein BLIJ_1297 [Bifidobacterium longum subsp. infantis ATCC 15697 = JCM 1222 = DSM 20088]|nr:hypothetical protein BLIJ_1297 [Bifidobacterium longum subsp. infantis ATCC 15697 = JCM 1222 = DSM 20088]